MKKLFITAATAILFSVTAFAAGGTKTFITGEENVSYQALNRFASTFKGAKNAAWTITANCQKVTFTLGDAQLTAFYNFSGDYLGTTQDVAYNVIPADAQKTIAANYAGYTVGEVIKYQNFDGDAGLPSSAYFVDLKKDKSEILVKVTPDENVTYFKKVK